MSELSTPNPITDKLLSEAITVLFSLAERKVKDAIENKKWKELFSASGENIIRYLDREGDFTEELGEVFSPKNMRKIAKRMGKEHGFSFPTVLHDELLSLLQKYGVDKETSETYTHFFCEQIIQYVQDNDEDRTLEMFLGNWRNELRVQYQEIKQSIDDIRAHLMQNEVVAESLKDIENAIKEKAYYHIDLDFFELDDETFKLEFDKCINQKQEMILIEGKSKEETLYRILNEIKHTFPETTTWVIKSKTDWERLNASRIRDCILIPFFNFDDTTPIYGNTCIYIYNNEDVCRSNKKIVLRKRTRRNLIKSLENTGMDYTEAYHLVVNTHGIFASMKHRLFRIPPSIQMPPWAKEHSEIIMAALLLGKWCDIAGDQKAFIALTGAEYAKCYQIYAQYEHAENPFIIRTESFYGSYYQIASIEDSWGLLSSFITDELWRKFLELAICIFSKQDSIPERKFEHLDAIKSELSAYIFSKAIKKGILRTFILCTCFDDNKQRQHQVDRTISIILETINTPEDWESISEYLPDMCEAAPKTVLGKLESDLIKPTGMIDLFYKQNGYINVLWAAELLTQLKEYRSRILTWLWTIHEKDIEYKNANTPQDILQRIFCAWYNITSISADEKEKEAQKAIVKYKNAWFVIASCLPNTHNRIISPLFTPEFREVDEPEAAHRDEAYALFHSYLKMCVKGADNNEKWNKIIKALPDFNIQTVEEVLNGLCETAKNMDDKDKASIKQAIRTEVYHHRRFMHADWAMPKEKTQLFENAYNKIIVDDSIYDYLYLFMPIYEYPLLHPVSYKENSHESYDTEEKLVDEDITRAVKKFKEKGLSVYRLIDVANTTKTRESRIGYVIGHYFDNDKFNGDVFNAFLRYSGNDDWQIYHYVRTVFNDTLSELQMIISKAKEKDCSNSLIARIISLQKVTSREECLIFHESDEIKAEFWKDPRAINLTQDAETEMLHEALMQCKMYGTLESYIEFIHLFLDKLSMDDLYHYVLHIEGMLNKRQDSSSIKWPIEKILERLQDCYYDDEEKSYHIARLEWIFGDLILWDHMKCLRRRLEKDPRIYAYLVEMVCRKDNEDVPDPVRQQRAAKMYGRFKEVQFCPAEEEGMVRYDKLKAWVNSFMKLLQEQNQSSLFEYILGELFANSPEDENGYMPCKAVCIVIEEQHSDCLDRAYETAIINKRGIYSPDGGKGETVLANQYQANADKLAEAGYSYTAQIYHNLSDYYLRMAEQERKEAEDEW